MSPADPRLADIPTQQRAIVAELLDEATLLWDAGQSEEALEACQWAERLAPGHPVIIAQRDQWWGILRQPARPVASLAPAGAIVDSGPLWASEPSAIPQVASTPAQGTAEDAPRSRGGGQMATGASGGGSRAHRWPALRAHGVLAPPVLEGSPAERRAAQRRQRARRAWQRRVGGWAAGVLMAGALIAGGTARVHGQRVQHARAEAAEALTRAVAERDEGGVRQWVPVVLQWSVVTPAQESVVELARGLTAMEQQTPKVALVHFARAQALQPTEWVNAVAMARAWMAVGDSTQARTLYQQVFTQFGTARPMWLEYADALPAAERDVAVSLYCLIVANALPDASVAGARLESLARASEASPSDWTPTGYCSLHERATGTPGILGNAGPSVATEPPERSHRF